MDPEMMRMAMETMSKMTPQQMAAMQQQMASIPQSVLQEQMRNVQNLTPEQKRMAAQQAQNFDPSMLSSQASQFATSSTQTVFLEAESLKKEGNRLHGQGQYNSAVSKYEAATKKLEGVASPEARALITACRLNTASCYLNTGLYQKCILHCNEVIKGDANNLKGLFRRGQAYLGQGSTQNAIADLQRAVELAVPEERGTIQAILDKAKSAAPSSRSAQEPKAEPSGGAKNSSPLAGNSSRETGATVPSSAPQEPSIVEEPDSPPAQREADGEIEDVDLTSEARGSSSQPPTSSSAAGMPPFPGAMPSMEAMMREPEAMRAMQSMMASMDPSDMAAMQRQAASLGSLGGLSQREQAMAMMRDPETMRTMQKMMSKMKPEDVAAMQRQAGNMGAMSGRNQEQQRTTAEVSTDNTVAHRQSSVVEPSQGVGPGGSPQQDQMLKMMQDPGMMQAMQGMMASMKPEDMAALQKQAAGLQGGLGGAGLGAQSQQMQAMMKDPGTLKAVQNMMSNMQPADLAAMYRQAGMNISDEQAEQMTSTLKKVSPEQMAKIMAVANIFQRLYILIQQNKAVVVGLVALLIGIFWKLLFSRS